MDTIFTGTTTAQLERRCPDETTVASLVADHGFHPVAAQVLAARCNAQSATLCAPPLASLSPPDTLPDMAAASARLARAVIDGETIGLVTDHDVDGVTSHAVLLTALTAFGVAKDRLRSYIGLRLKDGYGVSMPVVERILADPSRPSLVISADCGSSDEPRIAHLAAHGIETIVTDHHELGFAPDADGHLVETPPPSALAVVNPSRADNAYPDRLICGCMVAWLTLCATRARLIEASALADVAFSMGSLLDFVALGTVADCVSLGASVNNRAVVRAGLKRVAFQTRPCWRAAADWVSTPELLGARDLAFGIGPRINARGRLDDAMAGVHFLMSETDNEADRWACVLDTCNTERKTIEHELTEVADTLAQSALESGQKGLALWLEAGHPGVHGIVAGRVMNRTGHPVVCLSPHATDPDLATGSARAPAGIHIRDILETIHRANPELLVAFGGHAAAGGLTLRKDQVEAFQAAFAEYTADLDEALLIPKVTTDGPIDPVIIRSDLLDALAALEPFGQGFAPPLFEAEFRVLKAKPVGADKTHLQLVLRNGPTVFKGIWFRAIDEDHPAPCCEGDMDSFVFSPTYNVWNGERSIQLRIEGMVEI